MMKIKLPNFFADINFALSILCGGGFAVWLYGVYLFDRFPPTGVRLYLLTILSAFAGFVFFYWTLTKIIIPGLKQFDRQLKNWFIGCVVLFGLIIPLVTLDFEWLQGRYILFLSPRQSLEVSALTNPLEPNAPVTLIQFTNHALGEVSFNEFAVRNWERINGELLVTDIDDNGFSWQGWTGKDALLVFKAADRGGVVRVRWNGTTIDYDLEAYGQVEILVNQTFSIPFYASWIILLLFTVLGSIYLTGLFFLLALRQPIDREAHIKLPAYQWLIYALPMLVVWGIYLLVFWPGFMSPDSFDQWAQMTTWQFVDWQPPFHTLMNWVITRIWYSPGAVALFQIILMSSVTGWAMTVFRKLGSPKWVIWLTILIMAFSPANGMLIITLWKDIPFSATLIAVTLLLLQIVVSKGSWLNKPRNWVTLSLLMVLVSLLRQNGLAAALGIMIVILVVYRRQWRIIGLSVGLFLVIYFLIKGPFFQSLHIASNDRARIPVTLVNLAAAHTYHGTLILPEEREILSKAYPVYPLPYYCYRNSDLIFSDSQGHTLDRVYLASQTDEMIKLAVQLTLRDPLVTLQHFACNGAFVYRIYMDPALVYETAWMQISPNDFGFRNESKITWLHKPLSQWIRKTIIDNRMQFYIWRMPFWMYLMIAGCLVFCFRHRQWTPLIVLIPGLLVVLPLIILSLGQIFRYVYSMYLIAILFSGFFWFGPRSFAEQD